MTREGPVRNRPTELVGRHMRLTREAQILLVAEAMAQVRPLDEVATTCVLGGVEAYASRTQKDWYHKELARALKVGRQAAKVQDAQVEVLAAPERHEQPQQRHYAGAVAEAPTLLDLTERLAVAVALDDEADRLRNRWPRDYTQITDAHRAELNEFTIRANSVRRAIGPEFRRALLAHLRPTPDGPHEQPEQQQAQALAVAVAGFEPECRQCAALLDERGSCPVCAPRWRPCETGVRHAQTIPATRDLAYREHEKAHAAAHAARKQGAEPARQRRLDEASQDAWTAYRRWVDADSFAAQAGAFDHLRWADL